MQKSDMRRWVLIVDSDEKPQGQATQVGSDILAWRSIVPINELLSTRFRPQPLHTLTRDDASPAKVWQIAVHERVIDEQIRNDGFIDRTDYENQFLQKLNKAVKSGLLEALRSEKLGWHDQKINYICIGSYVTMSYLHNKTFLAESGPLQKALFTGAYIFGWNGFINQYDKYRLERIKIEEGNQPISLTPSTLNRGWKTMFLPQIPFERWIAGKVFLAKNGQGMIERKP